MIALRFPKHFLRLEPEAMLLHQPSSMAARIHLTGALDHLPVVVASAQLNLLDHVPCHHLRCRGFKQMESKHPEKGLNALRILRFV